ncbi:hypothetical protein GCM10010504_35410 [Streptomyces griseus]|nr:hypothetical protein GCM10010504_35410 [Streptomyces griseus]
MGHTRGARPRKAYTPAPDGTIPDVVVNVSGRRRPGDPPGAGPSHPWDLSGYGTARAGAKDIGQIGRPENWPVRPSTT